MNNAKERRFYNQFEPQKPRPQERKIDMALTKPKVREILSEAGVDSDHMDAALGSIMDGHLASITALREERDAEKETAERLKTENTRLSGDLQRAKEEADRVSADLKKANAETEKAKSDAKAAAESSKTDADKRVQAETEKLTAVQKELDELKAKYATAHKAEDDLEKAKEELTALKAEHETAKSAVADLTKVKEEYEAYKAEQEARATTASKEEAYKALLQDMNLSEKGITLAMKYTNMDGVELNDKGKIANAAALRKSVAEDWGDFITETIVEGAETANPPANNPASGKTAAEILAIQDDGDLFKAIEANPAAFGLV